MKHHQLHTGWLLVFWILCIVLAAVSASSPVYAVLPPRPTKTPTAEKAIPTREALAGTLLLNTQPAQDGLWSVVQWQGAMGNWNDVEGWKGVVQQGKTIWWVEQSDWGKASYRWVIFQEEGGAVLASSEPFSLPGSGKTLIVQVDLPN